MVETYHSNVIGCFIWELQETLYRSTNGTSLIRTTKTSWWHTTETSLDVSFETYLRRPGEIPVGHRHYGALRLRNNILIIRRGDVPLRRLGDVPLRRCWVFHLRHIWDVTGTYRETSLRRRNNVLVPGGVFIKQKTLRNNKLKNT